MPSPGELSPRLVARDSERVRCAYCHDRLPEAFIVCGQCQALYHPECTKDLKGCATFGCGVALPKEPVRPRERSSARVRRVAGRAIGAIRGVPGRVRAWPRWAKGTAALVLVLTPLFVHAVVHAGDASETPDIAHAVAAAERDLKGSSPTEALASIDRALALADRADLHEMRATAFEQAHDLDMARAEINKALALAPESAWLLARRGWMKLAQGNDAGALEDARSSLARESIGSAWALRATIAVDHGQYEQAVDDGHVAVKVDPSDARGWFALARGLVGKHEIAPALVVFDNAVALAPKRPDFLLARASVRLDQSDFTGAALDARKAIMELASRSAQAHAIHGAAYLGLGRLEDAVAAGTQAVEIDAKNALGWRVRGIARVALDEPGKALDDLDHAIDLEPDDARAYLARGRAHAALKIYPTQTREDYLRFVDLAPDAPEVKEVRAALDKLEDGDAAPGEHVPPGPPRRKKQL